MKKLTRTIALVLVLAMVLGMGVFALQEASQFISSTWAIATAMGDGKVDIDFSIDGTGTMNSIGATYIRVYKGDGTHVKTFSYTDKGYEYLMATKTYTHDGYVTFQGTPGINYYAVVTMYAGNDDGHDTRSYETNMVKA